MKLHLGCGDYHLPGWINIDHRMQPGVDRVDNIGILRRYQPGTVDLIYCSHALDHFSRWEYKSAIRRWFELLAPGGSLWVSVVDFEVVCKLYLEQKVKLRSLTGSLSAAQDYPGNVRHMHFDFELLSEDLRSVGFSDVLRSPDPFFDDCSASSVAGVPTSLNVIGVKLR